MLVLCQNVATGMGPLLVDLSIPKGYWAGIGIDQQESQIQGGRTRAVNGTIEAYVPIRRAQSHTAAALGRRGFDVQR